MFGYDIGISGTFFFLLISYYILCADTLNWKCTC
jgi:hypothetical protein